MKFIKKIVFLASLLVSYSAYAVPEIPDPQLDDIAMVQNTPQGFVIIYNPILCQEVGASCVFFRAHEYGHIELNHGFPPGLYPAIMEAQADYWAAANSDPEEILSAYYLFLFGGSSSHYQVYGTPQQRAARLRQFAIMAGTWIGP